MIIIIPLLIIPRYLDFKTAQLIFGLLFFLLIGTTINSQENIAWQDVFEIIRLIYSLGLVTLGIFLRKYLNFKIITDVLFISSLIMFSTAYMNPMNPDVLGFVQIWNPNVVGQAILHNSIIIYLLNSNDRSLKVKLQILILVCFALFTYSKASWILSIAILICLYSQLSRNIKLFVIFTFIALLSSSSKLFEPIYILGKSKIEATAFDKSAAEGGSFGARYGLAVSATKMFLDKPIFGVGIGNFERENKRMQFKLKENFYDDDNANSLIFHYLAVGGITSFLLIVFIIYTYFKRLIKLTDLKKLKILALIFFLVALNFQRELLTANTMWLFIGYLYDKNNSFN